MSLLNSITRDLGQTQRVSISDVRLNNLNFYDYQESVVDSLVKSILEHGQMENAIAYIDDRDSNGEIDGCKYTLLGGHTRYLAICKMMEDGLSDGYINISIVDKPVNEYDELELIMTNNVQRKKSAEVRFHEIQLWGKIYDELEEKPIGTKRDWIGSKIGMSGRGVDKVISKYTQTTQNSQNAQGERRTVTKASVLKKIKTNQKSLNNTLQLLDEANCNYMGNEIKQVIEILNDIINNG